VWICNAEGMALPEIPGSRGYYSMFSIFFAVRGLSSVGIA